jgi:hypothetical protein
MPMDAPEQASVEHGGDDEADTNGMALASLFLGVVWLFGLGSLAALVMGRIALRQIAESGGREGGRAIAIAGIAVGVAGLLSLGLVIAFVASSAHH